MIAMSNSSMDENPILPRSKMEKRTEVISLEKALIAACKKNDKNAQRQLYERYSKAMFNTAVRILANKMDAQDILQDSFIAAFRGIDKFEEKSSFGPWIKRIVINKSLNFLKRNSRLEYKNIEVEMKENDEVKQVSSIQIQQAIHDLPDACRAIFVMKVMEGLEHKEIAQYLSISVGTSKSQFHRAKKLLQVKLSHLKTF